MDLRAKINAFEDQETLASLEDALLACINEGGETGLNCVLELLSFRPNYAFAKLPHRMACILTALFWDKQGLSYLTKFALNSEETTIIAHILEALSHAAADSLDFLADLRLNMFGNQIHNLLEMLDFRNEKYHSNDFVFAAKEELLSLVLHYNERGGVKYPEN